MADKLIYIISGFGAITLIGVFFRMKDGFGPFNLRVVGIVLIATFSTLLALINKESLMASIGILGAIAGYLFGAKEEKIKSSSVSANSSTFGDNTKIAGRDLNEIIEKMEGNISNINSAVINQNEKISKILPRDSESKSDYLLNLVFDRQRVPESLQSTITRRQEEGWSFLSLSSEYQTLDGFILIFERPAKNNIPEVIIDHG